MNSLGGQVRVPKTAEILANRIRRSIIRGELQPEHRLPSEAALMVEFEVSRPTIREAIRILESEGLISVKRGARGGASVNALNGSMLIRATSVALQANGATLKDIYELRSIIEPPAARLLAEAHNPAAIEALRDCLARLREQIAAGRLPIDLYAEFHKLVLEGSQNVAMAVVGLALHDVVAMHLKFSLRSAQNQSAPTKRTQKGVRSFEKLIELVDASDGPGAEDHWRRHMKATGEVWLEGVGGTAVIDALE
jgi:DNA-binding FadR family transcriptional regulator